jgi:hypothetical protein
MKGRLLVVGIPSLMEAETIGAVARQIDQSITSARMTQNAVIVNADNSSADGTARAFLASDIVTQKASVLTPPHRKGKGHNFRALFEYALSVGALALVVIDADLEYVGSDWVENLAGPILSGKTDLTLPVYARFWYDANMTNHVVVPLIAGITGLALRQPMGGEFGFSRRLMQHLLEQEWDTDACGFGADIFCVLRAIKADYGYRQVPLGGGKRHSWRSENSSAVETEMRTKFQAMLLTAIGEALPMRSKAPREIPPFPNVPPLRAKPKPYDCSAVTAAARNAMEELLQDPSFAALSASFDWPSPSCFARLQDNENWVQVLEKAICLYGTLRGDPRAVQRFERLFLVRLGLVIQHGKDHDPNAVSPNLAQLLFRRLREAPG